MVDFKLIKGCLINFRRSSIIFHCLENLYLLQVKPDKSFPLWKIFTLVRWAYVYCYESNLLKDADTNDYKYILTLIEKFETDYDGLNFKGVTSINKSFRIIAYQQFPTQEKYYHALIDRQVILYTTLTTKDDLENKFEEITKIKLLDFLRLSEVTYLWLFKDRYDAAYQIERSITKDYVNLLKDMFPIDIIYTFLNLLTTKSVEEIIPLHKTKNERLQLFESNLFATKPFLLFNNHYRIIHRSIFIQTIKHFIYTCLKERHSGFTEAFGKRLENYIELGLRENQIDFSREKQIKRNHTIPNEEKVVDYLVENNILIECKATELKPLSGTTRLPDILSRELDHSIVKAYQQMITTANNINRQETWYGIIVTYKDLYIGFGEAGWDEFLKEPMEEFAREHNYSLEVLPPNQLFFVDIEYWDYMMQAVKDREISIKEILEKAILNNKNDAEKVMLFDQILNKYFKVKTFTLKYLNDAQQIYKKGIF